MNHRIHTSARLVPPAVVHVLDVEGVDVAREVAQKCE
jgi:hypothetical protein